MPITPQLMTKMKTLTFLNKETMKDGEANPTVIGPGRLTLKDGGAQTSNNPPSSQTTVMENPKTKKQPT